jgi:hypothetical protein
MKKVFMSVLVVQFVLAVTFASAECVDQVKFAGSWQWTLVTQELFQDAEAIPTIMKSLESGEKSVDALLKEKELRAQASGTTTLSDSGEMIMVWVLPEEEGMSIQATLSGTGKIDCDKLIVQGESTEVEISTTENMSDENKEALESMLPEMKKEMEAGMLKDFSESVIWPVLYFGDGYALIEDPKSNIYMIYKKE